MHRHTSLFGFSFALLAFSFSNVSLLGQSGSLTLSGGSAVAGGTTSLSLSLNTPSQLAGLEWTLTYPAAAVTAVTMTAGPALTAAAKTLYCNGSSGKYTCL